MLDIINDKQQYMPQYFDSPEKQRAETREGRKTVKNMLKVLTHKEKKCTFARFFERKSHKLLIISNL